MKPSGLEWRVGLFVFVGLVLVCIGLIKFSKGVSFLTPTYELRLRTPDIGGIKQNAAVLMAGLPIGSVDGAELDPAGRMVTLRLKILRQYAIPTNAMFVLEQAGFLGDQYVSVISGTNTGPASSYQDGDYVYGRAPFNLQEAARSAADLIVRVDETVAKVAETFERVDQQLLGEETLSNLTVAIANFRRVSEETLSAARGLQLAVNTNTPAVGSTISNLHFFSRQLTEVAGELKETVAINRAPVGGAVSNLASASEGVKALVADVQEGKGLVGGLLKDERLRQQTAELIGNLNVLSSNLARHGILYKPKPPRTNSAVRLPYGRTPHL